MNSHEEAKMKKEFEPAYTAWMDIQRKTSKGERKRRLSEISNHAEKMFIYQVWLPSFGHFNCLHAEYEVNDFKDGKRYLDFAYITQGYKICIEIDSYGTHWRDLNRYQFADHLIRQNHLVIDGWLILRFSYDDIMEKPRRCQQIIQQLFGRLSGLRGVNGVHDVETSPIEKAIYELSCSSNLPVTPSYVASTLGIHRKTAAKYLHSLTNKGLMSPQSSGNSRVVKFKVVPSNFHYRY